MTEVPTELALVESFANSLDVETGRNDLDSITGFRRWLRAHGLGRLAASVDEPALARARRFREALRTELLAHHEGEAAGDALARVSADVGLVGRFGPDGTISLGPAGEGVEVLLGELLAAIVLADAGGTWRRLKLCPADDCQIAFYDRSRNHSRRWCSMGVCGNRAKTRSFRARRSGTAPPPPGPG
jgi:predicted RNA-binding Zn ribbon-like protein